MTADEIAAVIERAEAKRVELLHEAKPSARKELAKIIAILPRAAELYRKEIAAGLAGNPEAVARARVVLRQRLGGPVRLERGKKAGSLFAVFSLRRQALIEGRTSSGSGGPI